MHLGRFACVALVSGTTPLAGPVWAQRTGDQARLILTVSAGAVGGKHLWSIPAQPVQVISSADTFAVGRRINSNLAVGFGGTYFPGARLGLAMEAFLIGLGFEDSCRLVFSSGSGNAATACQSIQGATKSATAVTLSAGPIYRVNSRSLISPYVRANLGLVFSNQSSLRTIGQYPASQGRVDLVVYDDDHETRVAPSLGLGAGFTATIGKAYQLRWEIRDNIVGVQRVTGPTAVSGAVPPHELEYKHLLSLVIGFDVVLERRRGRRY